MEIEAKSAENQKVLNRYLVLAFGMIIQLCAGVIYMWSVFRKPVSDYLSWDASLTSSIMLATFVLGIIVGGRFQDKFGPRPVTVAGSVLISLGIILSSLVTIDNPYLIYLTYGVIGGFGDGVLYTTTVSVVQKWFVDKRGFGSGFMVAAFGFSLVIFSPIANAMLKGIGVPNTFLALGLAFLAICLVSSIFIVNPPEGFMPKGYVPAKANVTKKQFYLITLSLALILPAYFILNPLFLSLGTQRGLSESMALLGVMITGIASASGRLITSWLSDLIGRKGAVYMINLITFVSILIMIFAKGVLFIVCIAAIAFGFGGAAGVYPAITADNFGTKHIGLNYGCVMIGFGTSAIVFPLISSYFIKNSEYVWPFLLSALCCLVAMILVYLQKKPSEV